MGYSRSKQAIERVRLVLNIMKENNQRFQLPCTDPLRMSYAIRDALAVAKTLPSESEIAALRDKFKIKIKHDYLLFEPRLKLEYGDISTYGDEDPALVLSRALTSMTIDECQSVLEVVGACIKHKAPEFIFPNATLDEGNIERLNKWADTSDYEVVTSTPLTLRKKDAGQDNGKKDGRFEL